MGDIKVYKFGVRWHWRCDRRGRGRCLGGPKHTQAEAFEAAQRHYDEEHRADDEKAHARYEAWVADGRPGL